jgi:uncharacterized membrane protein
LIILITLICPLIVKYWHVELFLPLKCYPVLINVFMLILFGYSLIAPPTAIERIARLKEPNLPPIAVTYTRRVTQIWCGFFVINACISLSTALWASPAIWSLYNGLISYLLMGLLFGSEYLFRQHFKRRQHVE